MTSQLSSGATLILRLLIPTVWLVFFGSFMVMGWVYDEDFIGPFAIGPFRWGSTLFVLFGALFIWATLWRLHRVDADDHALYISNYFRTYRYTRESIEKLSLHYYGLFHLARIRLKAKGRFGKNIWFFPSRKRLENFVRTVPGWEFTSS